MATVVHDVRIECADAAEYAALQTWAATLKPANWSLVNADEQNKADTYRVTQTGVAIPQA